MYQNNPNIRTQPFQPRAPHMARPLQGGRNPYGFGMERIAGQLALQPNLPGRSTNTMPFPTIPNPMQDVNRQRLRLLLRGY